VDPVTQWLDSGFGQRGSTSKIGACFAPPWAASWRCVPDNAATNSMAARTPLRLVELVMAKPTTGGGESDRHQASPEALGLRTWSVPGPRSVHGPSSARQRPSVGDNVDHGRRTDQEQGTT